jgi:hypothetical protein
VAIASRAPDLPVRRQVAFVALILGAAYTLLEVVVSAVFFLRAPLPPTYAVFEESGRTLHFDSKRGVYLTQIPSRFARFYDGKLEFEGTFQGNSVGLPDEDDFAPQRDSASVKRIAVFGDSFTAAQFLDVAWPRRVEELLKQRGTNVELLNFSVDGGGLANWWAMLTRIVRDEDYELDGVVFAVYGNDLRRFFIFYDHQGASFHQVGWVPSWDPETWPRSLVQARPLFRANRNAYVLSSADYGAALAGKWRPPASLRPILTIHAIRAVRAVANRVKSYRHDDAKNQESALPAQQNAERHKLIADIGDYLSQRGLPAMVIHVPDKDALLGRGDIAKRKDDLVFFARAVGAQLVEGERAFDGSPKEEIVRAWHPVDGHWAQAGSDKFAYFVAELLSDWPRK